MNHDTITIESLKPGDSVPWDLLELADPSRQQIETYLGKSACFLAKSESSGVGVLVLQSDGSGTMEIMNIAVNPAMQGKGIGRMLLEFAENECRKHNYKRIIIRTGNSSLGPLKLYQSVGFKQIQIEENYFLMNYDQPIFENGIQCKDRIVLEKVLN